MIPAGRSEWEGGVYRIDGEKKRDPHLRWALPDRVFFACGACHILAYAFLERCPAASARAVWLKPDAGFSGNHIFADGGDRVFDYHGYADRNAFLAHTLYQGLPLVAGVESGPHRAAAGCAGLRG